MWLGILENVTNWHLKDEQKGSRGNGWKVSSSHYKQPRSGEKRACVHVCVHMCTYCIGYTYECMQGETRGHLSPKPLGFYSQSHLPALQVDCLWAPGILLSLPPPPPSPGFVNHVTNASRCLNKVTGDQIQVLVLGSPSPTEQSPQPQL